MKAKNTRFLEFKAHCELSRRPLWDVASDLDVVVNTVNKRVNLDYPERAFYVEDIPDLVEVPGILVLIRGCAMGIPPAWCHFPTAAVFPILFLSLFYLPMKKGSRLFTVTP